MTGWILLIVFLLIVLAVPIWLAIRVMRHPEKDRGMKRIMEEQRGIENERGMQKFFAISYLCTGFIAVMPALLEDVFGIERILSLLIAGCVFCVVWVIAKWRFTGEFSKAGTVTFAVGLVTMVAWLIVNK